MSDIIHLLPDSIANQIAAGEVIQRPSSVVKELVENAIDAGADNIKIIIKDAGRTFIQVIDNGKGMSATDARMAFERHATSKIKTAHDLFALHTMGFRGEALASIAAVAQVELRSKQANEDVGTLLTISGSRVEKQECIVCANGSNFLIKNIFFNVPARRKFLKSNDTERRHIITELERIVLVNPEIEFSFIENDVEVLHFPAGNLRQRIINVVGKGFNQQLISLNVDTTLVKVSGFIGKPESARKTRAQQYFFVNSRYMRHPYFNKAISNAFNNLLLAGESPNYFIYFEVEPDTIDVNIHPTKTEIKFENEQSIWQILHAAVKEALGKFNAVPSIDFDTEGAIDIPIHDPSRIVSQPKIEVDPNYNPFKTSGRSSYSARSNSGESYQRQNTDWEKLYEGFENEARTNISEDQSGTIDIFSSDDVDTKEQIGSLVKEQVVHYQYKNKYILTSVKSGLMVIDQHRAHIRILFDKFITQIQQQKGISQRKLFPEIVELSASEASIIPYLMPDFAAVGFDLSDLGNNAYAINGVPSDLENADAIQLIHSIITTGIESGSDVKEEIQEMLALSMAKAAAIPYGQKLNEEEMQRVVDQLFSSPSHKYTPDGKLVISLMDDNAIDRMFSK